MIPVVLTVGALDPLGADGALADMRSFAALGVHGAAAVALAGEPAEPLDLQLVARQIATALADTAVGAVKIGALGSAAMVHAVAEALAGCKAPLVADPSLASRDAAPDAAPGSALVAAWREALLPRVEVVTVNLAEAALLVGTPQAATRGDMLRQGEALVALGCRHAVVGGGHGRGEKSIDVLVRGDGPPLEMWGDRLERGGMRGLSGMFASAIAAHLAQGLSAMDAVQSSKLFLSAALGAAEPLGTEDGPPVAHPLHRMWRKPEPPQGDA